jgi:hypothetical protein
MPYVYTTLYANQNKLKLKKKDVRFGGTTKVSNHKDWGITYSCHSSTITSASTSSYSPFDRSSVCDVDVKYSVSN